MIMKTDKTENTNKKEEILRSIYPNQGNLYHIISTGVVNCSLKMDIEKAMQEYADQQLTEYKIKLRQEMQKMYAYYAVVQLSDCEKLIDTTVI